MRGKPLRYNFRHRHLPKTAFQSFSKFGFGVLGPSTHHGDHRDFFYIAKPGSPRFPGAPGKAGRDRVVFGDQLHSPARFPHPKRIARFHVRKRPMHRRVFGKASGEIEIHLAQTKRLVAPERNRPASPHPVAATIQQMGSVECVHVGIATIDPAKNRQCFHGPGRDHAVAALAVGGAHG